WADVADEQKEFARNFGEEEVVSALFDHVSQIMKMYDNAGRLHMAQALVCNNVHLKEATFVAQYFKVALFVDVRMPPQDFSVCFKDNVEKLIKSRQYKGTSLTLPPERKKR